MARDFDGANDNISLGSDASIDDFTARTYAGWVRRDTMNANMLMVAKADGNAAHGFDVMNNANGNVLRMRQQHSTTTGWWSFGSFDTALHHVVIAYDSSATTNDPLCWIDGAAATVTENITPVGTASSDAANNLMLGENAAGLGDLNGVIGCFVYHSAMFDGALANRAKWWGRPMGGLAVYHPFWTEKTANEGTATADATATGTTVAALAIPTVRPGTAMLGCGVGW